MCLSLYFGADRFWLANCGIWQFIILFERSCMGLVVSSTMASYIALKRDGEVDHWQESLKNFWFKTYVMDLFSCCFLYNRLWYDKSTINGLVWGGSRFWCWWFFCQCCFLEAEMKTSDGEWFYSPNWRSFQRNFLLCINLLFDERFIRRILLSIQFMDIRF